MPLFVPVHIAYVWRTADAESPDQGFTKVAGCNLFCYRRLRYFHNNVSDIDPGRRRHGL